MWIVNLTANSNGSHNDHRADHITTVPDGWAMIPDDFEVPDTFPFVDIKAELVTHYHEVKTVDAEGKSVTEQHPYTMMTVTKMTPGIVPEPVETIPEPSQLDRIEAQVTYTAMCTDTLLMEV